VNTKGSNEPNDLACNLCEVMVRQDEMPQDWARFEIHARPETITRVWCESCWKKINPAVSDDSGIAFGDLELSANH
jgi:hypothetical protein